MEKAELIITALQQRIGELVSNYEAQIAVLRAEFTQLIQEQEDKQKAIDEYSQSLSEKTTNTTN
jgi:flagellar biosynthesis chaperone FliJ